MDDRDVAGGVPLSRPDEVPEDGAWSVRRLIQLIDEAIDSAGAQLARSAGLWADSPPRPGERDRPVARGQRDAVSTHAMLDEPDKDHGLSAM
ncbi:hypothetical protein AB0L64_39630 [Kribbella sp. NPDC051936]|uniref:hypothetical protein n=1 Tax=Kribbella sp. NPDC051936 TaxID=3154946 RepID=UPI00343A2B2F